MQLHTFLNTQSRSTKGKVGWGCSLWFTYHHISKGGPRSDLTTDLHEMKQMVEWTSAKGNKNWIFWMRNIRLGGRGDVMHGLKSGGGGANWDVYCKFNVQMSIHCFGVLDTKMLQNVQAT